MKMKNCVGSGRGRRNGWKRKKKIRVTFIKESFPTTLKRREWNVDPAKCEHVDSSYFVIPPEVHRETCSGRDDLCTSVLNDLMFVWNQPNACGIPRRKSRLEHLLKKSEEERFEIDIIIQRNADAIRSFTKVKEELSSLPCEKALMFQLDGRLGGDSEVLNKNSIKRIYGADADVIIQGLMKCPYLTVPLVLERLQQKDREWRSVLQEFSTDISQFWKERSGKMPEPGTEQDE